MHKVKNFHDNPGQKTANVDEAEISKFGAMASHWWDKNGALKALHDINPLRIGYINTRSRLKGKRVLDVGCGGGILSEAMAAAGAEVTGIDMGLAPLSAARQHLLESGLQVDYQRSTAEGFAEEHAERFDVITCLEMLEHVPDPYSVIKACRKLVKPNGHVFFATLNRNPKSFLFAIVGAEYLLRLVRRGTHAYARFIKPEEIELWGQKVGLKVVDVTGMHYNPFTRGYSLGGNVHVNYLMHLRVGP